MAVLTTQAQLEEVQAAITAILTKGQSFRIGDRQYGRADLAALEAREKRLLIRYNRERGNTGLRVAQLRAE